MSQCVNGFAATRVASCRKVNSVAKPVEPVEPVGRPEDLEAGNLEISWMGIPIGFS